MPRLISLHRDYKKHPLTRRSFLQLTASAALGVLAVSCGVPPLTPAPPPSYPLRVASGRRYLEDQNGLPVLAVQSRLAERLE